MILPRVLSGCACILPLLKYSSLPDISDIYSSIDNQRKMESIDCLYKQTRQAYSTKDLDQAIALYRDALKLRPSGHVDHPSIFHKLARCLVDRFLPEHKFCDLDGVITLVQQALELLPPPNIQTGRLPFTPLRAAFVNSLRKIAREVIWMVRS